MLKEGTDKEEGVRKIIAKKQRKESKQEGTWQSH